MTDPDLGDVLDRATDRIGPPVLAEAALHTARRRRTRRRGAAAVGAAVAVVLAVALGTQAGGGTTAPPPIAPSPTPTSSPPTEAAGPTLDALHAGDLPAAPAAVAAVLPREVRAPGTMPDLADDPVEAAVLARTVETGVEMLGTDGRWRRVGTFDRYDPYLGTALSPRGSRLVAWTFDNEVFVHDLATGRERLLPPPVDGLEPGESPAFRFLDEDTLVTVGAGQPLEVDAVTGATRPAAYDLDGVAAVDEDGVVVRAADVPEVGDTLTSLAVTGDLVAGTVGPGPTTLVVVADRASGDVRATLDVESADRLADQHVVEVVGLAPDGTVLLRAPAISVDLDGYRVVAWDTATGGLRVVSTVRTGLTFADVYADDLLR